MRWGLCVGDGDEWGGSGGDAALMGMNGDEWGIDAGGWGNDGDE